MMTDSKDAGEIDRTTRVESGGPAHRDASRTPVVRGVRGPGGHTGLDAIGGNMPFLGGRRIATQYGERYAEWLVSQYNGTGGTDYVGYFFLRASELLAERGSLGLITTSALAEGDNRRTVLKPLLTEHGFGIHTADTKRPWPGQAHVLISVLHMARGPLAIPPAQLDGCAVPCINSRLKPRPERPDPQKLPSNKGYALAGCFLRGDGFILDPDEAAELLRADPKNADVVRPFLTGDDLNNSPTAEPRRWVIDFFDRSLEEAKAYPGPFQILDQRVRPIRERLKTTGADAEHRRHWWRFANIRRELRRRAASVKRYLATARVSKHSMFACVDAGTVPSEQVVVIPLESWTAFAVLQSRIHGLWVELMATRMGTGLRYGAADCFETFPFPKADPAAVLPELEAIGEKLYQARAEYLLEAGQGLTKTYNDLLDPEQKNSRVVELRALHEEVDRAVLAAYPKLESTGIPASTAPGWSDIAVPPYNARSRTGLEDLSVALRGVADDVVDRLFMVNAVRLQAARQGEKIG